MYGPCRSTIGGEQALTPPSRHRLGRPLPYQLADSPQADPRATCAFNPKSLRIGYHRELANLSVDYARLRGTFLCLTTSFAVFRLAADTRLACLIHVASVHPEPRSNSNLKRRRAKENILHYLLWILLVLLRCQRPEIVVYSTLICRQAHVPAQHL